MAGRITSIIFALQHWLKWRDAERLLRKMHRDNQKLKELMARQKCQREELMEKFEIDWRE
jgi:hypothetical protein